MRRRAALLVIALLLPGCFGLDCVITPSSPHDVYTAEQARSCGALAVLDLAAGDELSLRAWVERERQVLVVVREVHESSYEYFDSTLTMDAFDALGFFAFAVLPVTAAVDLTAPVWSLIGAPLYGLLASGDEVVARHEGTVTRAEAPRGAHLVDTVSGARAPLPDAGPWTLTAGWLTSNRYRPASLALAVPGEDPIPVVLGPALRDRLRSADGWELLPAPPTDPFGYPPALRPMQAPPRPPRPDRGPRPTREQVEARLALWEAALPDRPVLQATPFSDTETARDWQGEVGVDLEMEVSRTASGWSAEGRARARWRATGAIRAEGAFHDGFPTGCWRTYAPAPGQPADAPTATYLEELTGRVAGAVAGPVAAFRPDGTVREDGLATGTLRQWSEEGWLAAEMVELGPGVRRRTGWSEDGRAESVVEYDGAGQAHGQAVTWLADFCHIRTYVAGERQGWSTLYWPSGARWQDSWLQEGAPGGHQGRVVERGEDGAVRSEGLYRDGKCFQWVVRPAGALDQPRVDRREAGVIPRIEGFRDREGASAPVSR